MNWSAFAIGALMALLYAVVCLMMWPYPELVTRNGGNVARLATLAFALTLFAGVSGIAAWMLHRRTRLWWLGQVALAIASSEFLVFVLARR